MNYIETLENAGYRRCGTCPGSPFKKGNVKFSFITLNGKKHFVKYQNGRRVATALATEVGEYLN